MSKGAGISVLTVCLLLLVFLPLPAQERTQASSAGSNRGGGGSAPDVRTSTPAVSTRTTSAPSYSSAGSASGGAYRDFGTRTYAGGAAPVVREVPNLRGTSFYSYSNYYYWNDFLFRLMDRFYMDPTYFSRFYRNNEPLLTPKLQRLAVGNPLILSKRLVSAVDELSQMVEAREAGQPIDKDLILAKVKQIRDLAKKIRNDDLLPYVDQRRDIDILKDKSVDTLGLEAVGELRAMALDLNSQLANLYNSSSTATISVDSLAQPSLASLSKGIERLCKTIEASAKRL